VGIEIQVNGIVITDFIDYGGGITGLCHHDQIVIAGLAAIKGIAISCLA
jgi:hypothetical protein